MRNQVLFGSGHDESPLNIVRLLKGCIARKDLHKGSKLHAYIQERQCLGKNAYIGSTLVSMYVKCGALVEAKQVLKELPIRNVISWNALIAGYAQQGQGAEALNCVDDMLSEGHCPTEVTFICALKACGSIRAASKGKEIHDKIVSLGMLEKHIVLGNSLVDMYVKCDALFKAQNVLKQIPVRDVVSWNALISGYAQKGQGQEALKCFDDMLCEGHSPDAVTFTSVLKACGSIGAAAKGEEIHEKVVSVGMLEKDIILGNALLDMYMKCGALAKAQQLLEELPVRDVFSWTALIAGYTQQVQGEEALKCFDDMLCEGHCPTPITFAFALKACGIIREAAKGEEIHEKIASMAMLEKCILLGNTLVDMYMKCGAHAKAQQVIEELPLRDVVSWNVLIAGYAQKGKGEEALKCFDDMLLEGHTPDAITFTCALKACGSIRGAAKGEWIHEKIVSMGMVDKDIQLGNALVDMYIKCRALAKAQEVLEELPVRDAVSWSALIAGYTQEGRGDEALKCFDDMLCEGHSPDAVTFPCVLKASGSIGEAAKGEAIHEKFISMSMQDKDIVLGTTLVDMYVKCGALGKARQVFEKLCIRDMVSWSVLIVGYSQKGLGGEALKCFDDMLHEGHCPDGDTFACGLKACGTIGSIAKGEEIHEKAVSMGILENDIVLGNALVEMYMKCDAHAKAQEVLEQLPIHDVVSWNVLIGGYVQQGKGEDALKCFDNMLYEGQSPTLLTFAYGLKACGCIRSGVRGEDIHANIVGLGMLERDHVLGTALMDMYVKCGALAKAQKVFKELPFCDVASWNVLIAGYAQQGQGNEALKYFDDMVHSGHSPTAITFACVLKACGSVRAASKGEEIHCKLVTMGMLEKDILLGYALVDMYVECGEVAKAQQVLERLPICDVISWNALTSGHVQQGQGQEALKCFDDMLCKGWSPSAVTFTSVLKACGSIGAAAKGEEIHSKVVSLGILEKDIVLATSLVDMYAKCGAVAKAQCVLEDLPVYNVVSWSALTVGYAQQGQSVEAISCFEKMHVNGMKPDLISLTAVLVACSHSALVDQAEAYFVGMSTKYGIHPSLEHYCCMTDVFARAGKFNKVLSWIAEMPYENCLSSWVTLLSGCCMWSEVKIGLLAFENALHLDKNNAMVYVLMADIYAAASMQEEAHNVELMRVANKAWKFPGCCGWTDVMEKCILS